MLHWVSHFFLEVDCFKWPRWPAGNSVAFFTPFGGPGLAGAEGPCEISRLDDDFRRAPDNFGPTTIGQSFAPAPPQGDDINCLIWQSQTPGLQRNVQRLTTRIFRLNFQTVAIRTFWAFPSYLVAKWDKALQLAGLWISTGHLPDQLFGFVRFGAVIK